MSNYVLGAGRLFFDPLVNGAYEGERYLGQSPGFSLSVDAERVQLFSSDGPTAEKLEDVVTQINRSASITLDEVSLENLELFLAGATSAASQSSGTVTNENINNGVGVKQGRWYQLGVTTSFPAGARSISAVVIKNAVPETITASGNYELDLTLGRIYIVPGGAIANGTVLTADYTRAAVNWSQVASGDLASRQGRLRYIEDATRGANRDYYMPKVDLAPSGEFSIKSRSEFAQLGFTLEVLTPDVGQAIYVTTRPVA
jgi:hypothetical protein